jgi:hypothetical protein
MAKRCGVSTMKAFATASALRRFVVVELIHVALG